MDKRTVPCVMNICQNHGKCFISVNSTLMNSSYCLCNGCFTGDQCEVERYSKNLWLYGISNENKKDYDPYGETIALFVLGITAFLSNLLSFQTFICSKKIRITNLGIYLILYSVTGLLISIIQLIFAYLNLSTNFKNRSHLNHLLQCAFVRVLQNSFVYCLHWLWLYIAVERVLIQHSFVNLYDSRRRSVISSLLLYILLPLSNLLPILFGRKGYNYKSADFCRLNFTSVGYVFYTIFSYVDYLAAPTSFLIACTIIFTHLIKHRRGLIDDESLCSSLILIASKHYDFFLPPIVYTLLTSPHFIFDKLMDCLKADSVAVSRTQTVVQLLRYSSLSLSFYIYVYLSRVYWKEFRKKSPFGGLLTFMKRKALSYGNRQPINANHKLILRPKRKLFARNK